VNTIEGENECDICAIDAIEALCDVERVIKWYRLLSFNAQLGNCIHDLPSVRPTSTSMNNIHSSITNIISTDADFTVIATNTERISRLAKDILQRHRATRVGPCHICNNANTAAKCWHVSPMSNPWPGIAADVPLCQRCYQIFYRAVKRGAAPVFADIHASSAYGRPPDSNIHSG